MRDTNALFNVFPVDNKSGMTHASLAVGGRRVFPETPEPRLAFS